MFGKAYYRFVISDLLDDYRLSESKRFDYALLTKDLDNIGHFSQVHLKETSCVVLLNCYICQFNRLTATSRNLNAIA